MSLSFSLDDITFALACTSLVISLLIYVIVRQQLLRSQSLNKELDAYAILNEFSQRTKRLEERLVDQKVKLEIIELRQVRQGVSGSVQGSTSPERQYPGLEQGASMSERPVVDFSQNLSSSKTAFGKGAQPSEGLDLVRSEIEALRFVLDSGPKGATAGDVQRRIGLSREHSARMMNSLFRKGFVERNSETRPFNYTISEKGKLAFSE